MTGTKPSTVVMEEYQQLLEQQKPGAALKLLREDRGITLEQITKQTLIPEWRLSDLENDQYEGLGGPIFVMGYLRKLAAILKVDPDPLITAYGHDPSRTQEGEPVVKTETTYNFKPAKTTKKSPLLTVRRMPGPMAIAVLLMVWVGTVVYMKYTDDDAHGSSVPTVDQPAELQAEESPEEGEPKEAEGVRESQERAGQPETSLESPQTVAQDIQSQPQELSQKEARGALDAAEQIQPAEVESVEASPDVDNQLIESPRGAVTSAVSTEATLSAESAPSLASESEASVEGIEEDLITLVFSEDCWVQISDATGKVIFAQLQRTGDNLQLFGQAPFSVMLGNAKAADISYNGEAVAFSPAPGRDTLRLTVGP